MKFERTHDMELVNQVIRHPRVYPHVSDDFSPPAEQLSMQDNEALWYVAVRDESDFLGIFLFAPDNPICWEVHTCLLPRAWGDRAVEAATEVCRWIWQNTSCRRIITEVPENNTLALKLALNSGLKQYGVNPRACLRGGVERDLILLGISKDEVN